MSDKQYIERYWRKATGTDIAKGPFPVARFRDGETEPWESGRLIGFHHGTNRPYGSDEDWFQEAEVYDAPDPGEGWRLIDHTEKPMPGDEHFVNNWGWCWCNEHISGIPYTDDLLLRRRIEQPKPELKYVPFTWEDREELRGRWIRFKNGNECQCVKFAPVNNNAKMTINCYTPLELLQNAFFIDTGEPVGKKVE